MGQREPPERVSHEPDAAVLLIDPLAERRLRVAQLVRRSAPGTKVLAYSGEADWTLPDSEVACALVAGTAATAGQPEFERIVHSLRRSEVAVACYGDGAPTWPLARRCQLLMLGVHPFLDSTLANFEAELGRVLHRRLRACSRCSAESSALHEQLGRLGIVAQSSTMLRTLRLVQRIAPLSDVPVLILGETGTGKELIARALHHFDPRRSAAPLVALNCGALPRALAEAELFGHARGAFSGAEHQRKGLIRAAHGGVLLLDEVGELDLSLQTRLLRVLQERRVRPLGHDDEQAVDVRVVAATHQDLQTMVRQGTFREDLFHRLSIMPVRVPALREREGDIVPLVRAFLKRHESLRRAGPAEATLDFMAALTRVEMRGNVRELENIVRCALAAADHEEPLGLIDLPAEIWGTLAREVGGTSPQIRQAEALAERDLNLARCVESCERSTVQAALAKARGSRTAAARILGISERGVYNKIRKYGLDDSRKTGTC